MRKTLWMLLAGLSLAATGPALAGGGAGGGDEGQGSDLAAISGHWAQQGAACDGDAARQMRISAEGSTLTVNLGEASAEEAIDSDSNGVVSTHSDEGRFTYRIDGEDLVITDLGDRSVERLTPCAPDDEDAGDGAAGPDKGGAAPDDQSDDDDDADDAAAGGKG